MLVVLAIGAAIVAESAGAHDDPRFKERSPQIKIWFKSLKSPKSGAPCCDEADGHLTNYLVKGNTYWVAIQERWYAIPSEIIVRNTGNPTGEGVVFYEMVIDDRDGALQPIIFCFVPNDTN